MPSIRRAIVIRVLVVALATAIPVSAAAATEPPAAAKKAFADGKSLYDRGRKQDAVEKFKEAYRLSKNSLLLYNIAFVYDELGDRALAVHYYGKFLQTVKPSQATAGNRRLATARLRVLSRELATARPPAAVRVKKFTHTPVETASARRPLLLTALVPSTSWAVAVYYRPAGAEEFEHAPMAAEGDELALRIPTSALHAGALHYYLEVQDGRGKAVDHSGSPGSPNVVVLEGTPITPRTARRAARTSVRPRPWLRWSATLGAAAFLGTGIVAHVSAGNYAAALEKEQNKDCPVGPCVNRVDEFEAGRDRWRAITYISLGAGVATAGIAGYLWYRDLTATRPLGEKRARSGSVTISAVPVIAPGMIGSSAVVQF